MPAPDSFALGIDFGTSNTVAMLRWPDGRVKPLLFDGSPLLPSAVFGHADGRLFVGTDALHHARFEPARLAPNPKRNIDESTLFLGDRDVATVDVVAAVLRHVSTEALRVTGGTRPHTSLTHPAGWGPVRRGVLVDAAGAAGLGEVRLVPEPVAAARYFTGVLGQHLAVGQALAIYDLGAGTFDASVGVRTATGVEIVAVDGIDDIGGLDLDAAIVDWLGRQYGGVQPEVWRSLSNPTGTEDQRRHRLLWDDVRVAKEILSRVPSVVLPLPGADGDVHLGREEFETIVRPLIARTVRTTKALLQYARPTDVTLAGVFLVGGASRVPLVATLLHRELGVTPTVTEQPELVVAEGALQPSAGNDGGSPTVRLATGAPVSPQAVTAAVPAESVQEQAPATTPTGETPTGTADTSAVPTSAADVRVPAAAEPPPAADTPVAEVPMPPPTAPARSWRRGLAAIVTAVVLVAAAAVAAFVWWPGNDRGSDNGAAPTTSNLPLSTTTQQPTPTATPKPTVTASGSASCNGIPAERLCPGYIMLSDRFLVSPDRMYQLYMQSDGNLVLQRNYDRAENDEPVWASDTAGNAGAHAEMRPDGNFVIVASSGAIIWSTKTTGNPGSIVVVGDRPNVAVVTPANKRIWTAP
ncbi:Hsp70 family protein [Dactylosporangium cerinum]